MLIASGEEVESVLSLRSCVCAYALHDGAGAAPGQGGGLAAVGTGDGAAAGADAVRDAARGVRPLRV